MRLVGVAFWLRVPHADHDGDVNFLIPVYQTYICEEGVEPDAVARWAADRIVDATGMEVRVDRADEPPVIPYLNLRTEVLADYGPVVGEQVLAGMKRGVDKL